MPRLTYDWVAIQKDRSSGMSVRDLCKKYGCSDVALYHRTKGPSAYVHPGSGRASRLNWPAIQQARAAGMSVSEICKKFKVSNASVYTKTKNVGRHNRLTPTASPFEGSHAAHATNGNGLREQINGHLAQALAHAKNHRDEIHAEARYLDEVIQKLEAAVR